MATLVKLPTGAMRAFTFNTCHRAPFSLQIWRLEENQADYHLIWHKRITVEDQRHTDGDTNIVGT